ncbi:substrate-binding domain-containing protein [Caldimonas tepidiphila]|uniref:helix-turn-helix transcriptional regulator n=1 Tax=Caldimonas tepidiphila TaxID=2315841 RepID=UPI000E5BCC16|nr:substrate-binding domain-containing protein [Caldimonas tepidiphila]
MHRIHLSYSLGPESDGPSPELHHPLMRLLDAVREHGSISGAARALGLSYRHAWGELRRWEEQLGHPLVLWNKGQAALLSPFGEKLLWAERGARARLAPQIEALRSELQRAFAVAFDDSAGVVPMLASHDDALPQLRALALRAANLHLDIGFTGSVDALHSLNQGRCLLAGFHALTDAPARSPTARVYRPLLKPGRHKLIGFAQRTQGLIVPPGNPRRLQGLAELLQPGLRFAARPQGSGTRVVLEELLAAQGLDAAGPGGLQHTEPSHEGVAEAVAAGRADAAFGIEAAARRRGLDFVPLARERYFLVGLAGTIEHPEVRQLREVLASPEWTRTLASIPGYAPDHGGEVLSLRRELPWWTYRSPRPGAAAPAPQ